MLSGLVVVNCSDLSSLIPRKGTETRPASSIYISTYSVAFCIELSSLIPRKGTETFLVSLDYQV
jgi:hypothetical protein